MSKITAAPARKKIVHQLGSPFTSVSWPEISQEDQDTILELLCDYLSPIGKHRRLHCNPSKGKRAEKKRKRRHHAAGSESVATAIDKPPRPEMASQVDVGFASITRCLQSLKDERTTDLKPNTPRKTPCYSVVFVCRGNQTSAFNSHFPQMIAASSQDVEPNQTMRLVGFSKPCSDRISASLGVARVSSLALHTDAAGSGALVDLIRKTVKPIECGWLGEARDLKYRPTSIASIETSVGPKKVKQVVPV